MSIMSLGRGNGNGSGNGKSPKRVEAMPPPYPPRPVIAKKPDQEAEQLKLGHVTLEAVDRLTGMTADEIERVAEQVLDGAEETAAVLRQLAARVRENGMFASDRLARFVRVANQCGDIARSMQQSIDRRDESVPPEPKKAEDDAEPERAAAQADGSPVLGALEQRIEENTKDIRNGTAP